MSRTDLIHRLLFQTGIYTYHLFFNGTVVKPFIKNTKVKNVLPWLTTQPVY